ncbi:MAG TPA: class I SAM-dependent methyltransferase [Cytophagaceae bacterium]|jgi:hypothetical protein
MNELQKFFEVNEQNLMNKWVHYFDIYERYFSSYRDKEVVILEIGVYQGGSINMWKEYFGNKAKIYAIDINPLCKRFESENVRIFIGSQSDRAFLQEVINEIPELDILIDDGGHYMDQQIISFEELYPHVKEGGIYLCEDLHTSYWKDYGGGLKKSDTFIEYSKNLIDLLNSWHYAPEQSITQFTRSTYSLHYYDSVLVIEKRKIAKPESRVTGKPVIDQSSFDADDTRNKVKSVSANETSLFNKLSNFVKKKN